MSFAILGIVLAAGLGVIATAHVLPIAIALSAGDTAGATAFAVTGILTGFVAGALIFATRGGQRRAGTEERLVALVFVWAATPVFGALPFVGANPDMLFVDAYFDAVSAMTTTGAIPTQYGETATVAVWRATLQWIGGFATLMMAVAVLAPLGLAGLSLRRAPIPPGNTSGPFGRYWPAMLTLGLVYGAVTLAGLVGLMMSGVALIPAMILAFSAAATGGMAAEPGTSLLGLGLVPAFVLAAMMFVGATGYHRHAGLVRRSPADYWRDPEFRYAVIGVFGGGFVLAAVIGYDASDVFSLSRGILWMASLLSTSVHAVDTAGFESIPLLVALAIVFVGGSTMATAGGLKLMRLALLAKQGVREISRLAHPHGIVHTEFGGRPFTMDVMRGVWALFVLLLVCALVVCGSLTAFGLPFEQAVAASIGALSNAGPVLGFAPGPDGVALGMGSAEVYASMPPAAKIILCLAMIAGRVEILALLGIINSAAIRDS